MSFMGSIEIELLAATATKSKLVIEIQICFLVQLPSAIERNSLAFYAYPSIEPTETAKMIINTLQIFLDCKAIFKTLKFI